MPQDCTLLRKTNQTLASRWGSDNILEHILRKVKLVEVIDDIYIVTSDKFYSVFQEWVNGYSITQPIKVIYDNTISIANLLGVIADIQYVIERESIRDDILVMAGENLFEFDLGDLVSSILLQDVGLDCIRIHELNDPEGLCKTGCGRSELTGQGDWFGRKARLPKVQPRGTPFGYLHRG